MMWHFFDATTEAISRNGIRPYGHFGSFEMMNPGFIWVFGLMCLVTWILVILALVSLVRWLWKKGNK